MGVALVDAWRVGTNAPPGMDAHERIERCIDERVEWRVDERIEWRVDEWIERWVAVPQCLDSVRLQRCHFCQSRASVQLSRRTQKWGLHGTSLALLEDQFDDCIVLEVGLNSIILRGHILS